MEKGFVYFIAFTIYSRMSIDFYFNSFSSAALVFGP